MATGHCTSYVVRLGTTVRGVEYPLFLLHRDILLNLGRNVVFLEVIVIQKSEKGTDPDTWVNIRHFGSLFWTRSNYPTWGGSSSIRHKRQAERELQGMFKINCPHALEGGGGVDNTSIPK